MKRDVKRCVKQSAVCASDKPAPKWSKAPVGHLSSGALWDVLALDYLGLFLAPPPQGKPLIARINRPFHQACWDPSGGKPASRDLCVLTSERICSKMGHLSVDTQSPRAYLRVQGFQRVVSAAWCLLRMTDDCLPVEQKDWDLHPVCLATAYRAPLYEATSMTPNLKALGREVRLPADLMFVHAQPTLADDVPWRTDFVEGLRMRSLFAHEVACKFLKKGHQT